MSKDSQDLTVVKVLIVEDEELQAQGIEDDLLCLAEEDKHRLGVDVFVVHQAASVIEAQELLSQATKCPYDLLFLDLGLPLKKGWRETDVENGFTVLNLARDLNAVKQVIVVSKFPQYENVRRAFLGGALDFIEKVARREVVQAKTVESLKNILVKKSDWLLGQRLCDLIPYDEQVLAYRFSACFSGLTQDVVHETEQLEDELGERLGLNAKTDSQDSLLRHLEALSVAVRKSKQSWADLQEMLPKGGEEPKRYVLADLLREIETELLPCLKVKQVKLDIPPGQPVEVLSFHKDTRVVIRELILGALSKLTSYSESERTLEISISITPESEYAKVIFNGDLFHFDEPTRVALAKGQRQNDGSFGQAWGLSVAQHIALRGGGRLQFGSPEQPDSVTYFLPLARHD